MTTATTSCDQICHDEQLTTLLSRNSFVGARRIQVCSGAGKVIIDGDVDSFFAKQMAQELIRKVDSATTIENRLNVLP